MSEKGLFLDRLNLVIGNKSIPEAARMFGINESAVRTYQSGRSLPGLPHVKKIADAAGVTIDWLAGRKGASKEYVEGSLPTLASSTEAGGLIAIPFHDVTAGAGQPKNVEIEEIETWLWISRKWAARYGKTNLSIFKVSGDSMLPKIEPGDLLLLNSADKSRGQGIRLIRLDDSLAVKYCDPLPKRAVRMRSDNPDYEPYTAKKGEYEIIGAVVAVIKVLE